MCGIAGALFPQSADPVLIQSMTDALRHRGPDDEGFSMFQPDAASRIIFGHRRLAILDLTEAGHQPMSYDEGRYWITYNGEIFNYEKLREELQGYGCRFQSQTDTEVVLAAYARWGEACLNRFNGMWAFAIWDNDQKKLFCARDRFGIKPFYYTYQNGNLIFASEIKALLAVSGETQDINEEAVYDFLVLGQAHHESRTFFSGISQLPAGASLSLRYDRPLKIQRWYHGLDDLSVQDYQPEKHNPLFFELFEDAVRFRLRSDVPVGTCLSGGLDSSSIAAVMASLKEEEIDTFTSCFENPQFDERQFVRPLLDGMSARCHWIFPQGKSFWQEWPDLMRQQEEPFGSTSIYAQWCVMREAAAHNVPVLLDGQGGDELLAGYPRYRKNGRLPFRLLASQTWARKVLAVYPPWQSRGWIRSEMLKRFQPRAVRYVQERGRVQGSLRQTLLSDFLIYSLPALLRYEDKNSMRFSIETRLPFLDHRLVEFMFSLGDESKIDRGWNKRILRDAMAGKLPEKIRARRDKMGFVTPQSEWLKEGREFLKIFFQNPGEILSQWVNPQTIRQAVEAGRFDHPLFWRVLNLQMWIQTFFETRRKTDESSYPQPVLSS